MSAPMKKKREGIMKTKNTEQKKDDKDTERKKILEAKIRRQVACEEKAFRIVERLIENPITEEFLIDACQFITPPHYDDIVEERGITKTCGYPICSKSLTNVLKQKYQISTRANKVYDITERKNFCSNFCYKASKYLHQQISTSPLWSREEESQKINLLASENRGLPGLEVVGPVESVRKEIQQLNLLEKYEPKEKNKAQDDKVNTNNNEKLGDNSHKSNSIEEENLQHNQTDGVKGILEGEGDTGNLEPCIGKQNSESDTGAHISEISDGISNLELSDKIKLSTGNDKDLTLTKGDSDDVVESGENKVKVESETRPKAVEVDNDVVELESQPKPAGTGNLEEEDKIQHLMKLLDKRKQLLGQLAEIETASDSKNKEKTSEVETLVEPIHDADKVNIENSNKKHMVETLPSPCEEHVKGDNSNICGAVEQKSEKTVEMKPKVIDQTPEKVLPGNVQKSAQTVIQVICQSIRSWVTPETKAFLKIKDGQDSPGFNRARADFEAMYQALCQRVDAGEFEIEDIGVESQMEDGEIPHQSLPEYEKLKEDTDQFASRVKQFYAGKLFIDPVEKDDKEKTPVYLPTVDTYHQMQIRQKIVMDRLQKVISEVLSPLKLTIQDVYSEYKEMISTFRLDSKNILYKPAEWTIVNLILLRMLARKNMKIKTAFLQPSSITYFKILLGKLGTHLNQIDMFIENVLLRDN